MINLIVRGAGSWKDCVSCCFRIACFTSWDMNEILPSPQISKEIRHQNWWRKNPGFFEELRAITSGFWSKHSFMICKLGLESGFLHTALKFNIASKNRQCQKETHFSNHHLGYVKFRGCTSDACMGRWSYPVGFRFFSSPKLDLLQKWLERWQSFPAKTLFVA